MFGNKNQLAGLMKKAQEMQKNVENAQNEIANLVVDGSAQNGLIKLTMSGKYQVKSLDIDESLMDDKEMLEDLLLVAFNNAASNIEKISAQKMQAASSGMPNIPGMKLPF